VDVTVPGTVLPICRFEIWPKSAERCLARLRAGYISPLQEFHPDDPSVGAAYMPPLIIRGLFDRRADISRPYDRIAPRVS